MNQREQIAVDWVTSQSQSHIATDGQSVCLGVEPRLGLMTRCFFLFESYCPVHVRRLLWREVGSVICQYWVTVRYTQLYKNRKGREGGYLGNQWRGEGKGLWSKGPAGSRTGQVFKGKARLPLAQVAPSLPFLFIYSWVYLTVTRYPTSRQRGRPIWTGL
jgi:hypothetical protein